MFPCCFLQLSHPLLPPTHVHKSVLYVCISIAALQIGSSVHLSRVHIYELIYIFFLFLTYFTLCNRFIHLIRTDSNAFFLWLCSIPLYICTIGSLSIHLLMDILGCIHVLAVVNSVQLQRTLGFLFLFQLWFPDCWVIY